LFREVSFKKILLVGFRYVFGKNYDWGLPVAKNMYKISYVMFGSVIVVAFQSVFYLEIHQNIFLFFKNYFWYHRMKIIWKQKKY